MTITKEIVASLADVLYAVTLRCEHCNSMITMDLSDKMNLAETGQFMPHACGVCRKPFDSALANIELLRKAYAALGRFGDQITFRVQIKDDVAR